MARLKIGSIADETPIKLSVVLPATVHRDLASYAAAVSKESGQTVQPAQLVGPMLMKFMATDRIFRKWRRSQGSPFYDVSTEHHASRARGDARSEQ